MTTGRSLLSYARRKAYASKDPFWWSNLGAVYATRRPPDLKRARWWYARGQVAALTVLAHAYEHGEFTFQRSATKTRRTKKALRRAWAQLRREHPSH